MSLGKKILIVLIMAFGVVMAMSAAGSFSLHTHSGTGPMLAVFFGLCAVFGVIGRLAFRRRGEDA
jgi:hypothetical protein